MVGIIITFLFWGISLIFALHEYKRAKKAEKMLEDFMEKSDNHYKEIKNLFLKKLHEDIPDEIKRSIIETYIEDNWEDLVNEVMRAAQEDYENPY